MPDSSYNLSVAASALNTAITKANAAAPQSTTYTKTETNNLLNGKQAALVVGTNLDNTPVENSTNPITSGGVYSVIGDINAVLEEVL